MAYQYPGIIADTDILSWQTLLGLHKRDGIVAEDLAIMFITWLVSQVRRYCCGTRTRSHALFLQMIDSPEQESVVAYLKAQWRKQDERWVQEQARTRAMYEAHMTKISLEKELRRARLDARTYPSPHRIIELQK